METPRSVAASPSKYTWVELTLALVDNTTMERILPHNPTIRSMRSPHDARKRPMFQLGNWPGSRKSAAILESVVGAYELLRRYQVKLAESIWIPISKQPGKWQHIYLI